MADILVLTYTGMTSKKREHASAADSLKMLSFKTANKELTDTKLGKLIDGADSADEHIHDARYFQESEFISASVKPSKIIQDLTYTAKNYGAVGITVEYTSGATAGEEVVTVIGNAISVQIADNSSTATQIKTAVDAYPAAAALVDVAVSGTGSNAQTVVAAQTLITASSSKPLTTNAAGMIDSSLINDGDVSHDSTAGAAASTVHTAFPLLAGGRDFTAIQKYNDNKTFTDSKSIVDKKYVDDLVAAYVSGSPWLDAIDEMALTPPGSPTDGMRVLINGTGTGDFASHDYAIATYVLDTTSWTFTEFADIAAGATVRVKNSDDFYLKGSSSWSYHVMESTAVEADGPLFFSDTYELDLSLGASGGLKVTDGDLFVEPNDFAGEGLVDDGSDNLAIDWSTAFNDSKAVKASDLNTDTHGKGASIIRLEDAASNFNDAPAVAASITEQSLTFTVKVAGAAGNAYELAIIDTSSGGLSYTEAGTSLIIDLGGDTPTADQVVTLMTTTTPSAKFDVATSSGSTVIVTNINLQAFTGGSDITPPNVESAIATLYTLAKSGSGIDYTAGEDLIVGDLVYVSANDAVAKLSDITLDYEVAGIIIVAGLSGSTVQVARIDKKLTGVLTAATANAPQYWTGSAWSETLPTATGSNVYKGGIAKNTTDMALALEHLYKLP